MTPETKFKNKVKDLIKGRNDIFMFKVAGSATQESGIPDFVGCYKGKFIALELKREDGEGTLSGVQKVMIRKIQNAGGLAMAVDDIQQIEDILRTIEGETS